MRTRSSIITMNVPGIGLPGRPLDPGGEDRIWVSVERFEHVLDAVLGQDGVRLTFDDGNASDHEIALPRLHERGLRAEFFVPAGRLGERGRLDEGDVRELVSAGMRVGSYDRQEGVTCAYTTAPPRGEAHGEGVRRPRARTRRGGARRLAAGPAAA